jgi:hypothetical protein
VGIAQPFQQGLSAIQTKLNAVFLQPVEIIDRFLIPPLQNTLLLNAKTLDGERPGSVCLTRPPASAPLAGCKRHAARAFFDWLRKTRKPFGKLALLMPFVAHLEVSIKSKYGQGTGIAGTFRMHPHSTFPS